jgi:hypothetical protein
MSRRRWIIPIGAVLLVGLGAVLAIGVVKMNAANSEFQRLRASIAPPDGWVLASENTRLTGLFGTCFTSVLDVRACPSAFDGYAVTSGYSEGKLTDALESSGVTITMTDCEEQTGNGRGTFTVCSVAGQRDGHTIKMQVIGTVDSTGVVADPEGRLSIDR